MSDSATGATQVITLPRGGGEISGLGETFAPDLHTGTGNFTVPIALPPGRNGFQPELNLVYSTGSANGPFGLGWSLSIPGVDRKTSDGVPLNDDDEDTFILSGAEDLVPVETQGARTRYRPRTEGLYARIYHHRDAASNYWEVQSKDGLVSRYGTEGMAGTDPAAVADPAHRNTVFNWKLTQTQDPFGNRIIYEYERDAGEDGPHRWDQLYLKRIRYVDYGDARQERFLVSVTFEYGDTGRPDPFSEYRSGFEIRTRRRCERIVVRTHAGEARLVRTYALTYLDERVATGELPEAALPLNGVSLLSRILVVGHDGDEVEELPPLEFGYTAFEPEGRDFFPLGGRELPAQALTSPELEMADLTGNGLPDFFQMNGTVRYWRNLGGGRFDLPREMREAPAGLGLAESGVQLIDADGDGRIDLMVSRNGLTGYFPLQHNGEWDRRSFRRYRQAPSFDLEDPEVQLVDLNGDGVTDAIRSGSRLECFFNDPQEGWSGTRFVPRRDIDDFPNVNFSDPRVRWADMSGDRLQDVVLVHDGNIEYWPNLGRGDWGRRITMRNSPRFPYGYDPRRILVGDVDGDGLADFIYVDHCRVLLWINQSGNGWSDPIEIDGTPPVTNVDAVRLSDVLGTGVSGVLWSKGANGTRDRFFFLDFTGGVKPYLLGRMDNHMGAVTLVEYLPSTRFYLEDQQHPEARWQTPLPFPVQVVGRVEVIDQISQGKLATEYRYHHGYWDGAEREFRGFGFVEQFDTETFAHFNGNGLHGDETFDKVADVHFSPPTLTKTWFYQGPVGEEFGPWYEPDYSVGYWPSDPQQFERPAELSSFLDDPAIPRRVKRDALRTLRGRVLRSELYALDGSERECRPYTVTEQLHSLREEASPLAGDDRPRIFFPHTIAQRTTQWERGEDPMTQFAFTGDFDAFGQPRRQTQVACPRGWRNVGDTPGQPYLATRSRTTFAEPATSDVYIHDRVASATTYEIENDGRFTMAALRDLPDDSAALRVIGQAVNNYDGDAGEAYVGRPPGEVGQYGALVRTENLVLTETILYESYKSDDVVLSPPEMPPYLAPSGLPAWTAEYPEAFRDGLPPLAGYTFYEGDAWHERGYFVTAERRRYDFHGGNPARGLLQRTRDPLGGETAIEYDTYALLPTTVTDPAGLTTAAEHDYRVLQPSVVTDPNGNRNAFGFTPQGLSAWVALMGKEGEAVGDTPEVPGTRFAYDFLAFVERRQPVSVRTIRREHHVNDTDVPLPDRVETIETVEYSDGFGRLLQTRAQAEDITFGDPVFGGEVLPADQTLTAGDAVGRRRDPSAPSNVIVSGWQVYDNKGQVVQKYEPFFSTGWDCAPPGTAELGQRAMMFYDPRGQVIRTVNSDGSEQRVIYGVPNDLNNPERFAPTPWEAFTYDANDNAGRTHPSESRGYESHWNTPASIVIDALGRTVKSVERNGYDKFDWYTTLFTYDIRGNLLTVTDALEREAFKYAYDLSNNLLRIENIDARLRRIVLNAVGNEIERRDSKGALILQRYDVLLRPTHMWARDASSETVTLREHLLYGDSPDAGLTEADKRSANLRGQPYRHFDEAGRLTLEAYDFKGNVREKVREVFLDDVLLAALEVARTPFRVDWQPPDGLTLEDHASTLLNGAGYHTSSTYDALSRVKEMRYPEDVEGARAVLRPAYNRAGALEQVTLDNIVFVDHIAYNAKGQRSLIAYGNGVMTRFAYDQQTFRLARLRSDRYTKPDPGGNIYVRTGAPLQDFGYAYDLAGNIAAIHDRTPESGIPGTLLGSDALDRAFTYDPLYRLSSATGRECDRPHSPNPWHDEPRCTDPTRVRAYTQHYGYDPLGNMRQLRHIATGGSFTRTFSLVPDTNRLHALEVGNGGTRLFAYAYDANGNMTRETTSRHFMWDHSDRMTAFRTQIGTSERSIHASYLYGAGGVRVMKLVRRQGGQYDTRVYIDGLFEHYRWNQRSPDAERRENNRLHIMDDKQHIALMRHGPTHPDDIGPKVQYYLANHLGSINLVISGSGSWINREEYFPYGETSFGSFSKKRYRYTSKERDEESGFSFHERRYYLPWLTKWASCDPLGPADGANLYQYVKSNPLNYTDLTGQEIDLNTTRSSTQEEQDQIAEHIQADTEEILGIRTEYDADTGVISIGDQNQDNEVNEEDFDAALARIDELREESAAAGRCGGDPRCLNTANQLLTEYIESLLPTGHERARRLEVNLAHRSPINNAAVAYGEADAGRRDPEDRQAIVVLDPKDFSEDVEYTPRTSGARALAPNEAARRRLGRAMGPMFLLIHEREHNVRGLNDTLPPPPGSRPGTPRRPGTPGPVIARVNRLRQALGFPRRMAWQFMTLQQRNVTRLQFTGGYIETPNALATN